MFNLRNESTKTELRGLGFLGTVILNLVGMRLPYGDRGIEEKRREKNAAVTLLTLWNVANISRMSVEDRENVSIVGRMVHSVSSGLKI